MEEQIFYKKVYIHSEDDLPKEAGFYFVNWTPGHAHNTTMGVVYYDESIKGLWFGKGWYDWYLLPVTLPVTLPTDEEIDIEGEFKQAMKRKNQDYAEGYVEGLQDGWLIKSRLTAK
jgi:hypothetical protein